MSALGQQRPIGGVRTMSALPPKATKPLRRSNCRNGPKATIATFCTAEKQRASSLFNAGLIVTINPALGQPLHQCSNVT
jgi:hypothetical protein